MRLAPSLVGVFLAFHGAQIQARTAVIVADTRLDSEKLEANYARFERILAKSPPEDVECDGSGCSLLGEPETVTVLKPRDPTRPYTKIEGADYYRVVIGMNELPPDWVMYEDVQRLRVETIVPKPWALSPLRLPEARDMIAGSRNVNVGEYSWGAGAGAAEARGSWVPAGATDGGSARLQILRAAVAKGDSLKCLDLGINEDGGCGAYIFKASEGGSGIVVCRLSPEDTTWITSSCTLAAVAVGTEYWIEAYAHPRPEGGSAPCCGETYFRELPCTTASAEQTLQAIVAALGAPPLGLTTTVTAQVVRAVAKWRVSPFLGGAWREHFSLVVQLGESEENRVGYLAEIDYVLKSGASVETEEMHLPNAQQKNVAYEGILTALESGVKTRLCPAP